MQDIVQSRTPMHLWIVGVLATLWNAFGATDYLLTRMRNTDYLAMMMPGVDPAEFLAYLDGYPIWAQFGWGLGVWTGLLGAVLLLARSRWAVHAFALSLVGMALSFTYVFTGPPMPGAEAMGAMNYVPLVIVAIGVALLYYAHRQRERGVLR
ncbi:MAG TPA: hypothetical protein VM346_10110 [Sphingomicrobium sp.]|jgi:hypothetical protein|nr:hypothetical protein [Sphingomicrobium sp.]